MCFCPGGSFHGHNRKRPEGSQSSGHPTRGCSTGLSLETQRMREKRGPKKYYNSRLHEALSPQTELDSNSTARSCGYSAFFLFCLRFLPWQRLLSWPPAMVFPLEEFHCTNSPAVYFGQLSWPKANKTVSKPSLSQLPCREEFRAGKGEANQAGFREQSRTSKGADKRAKSENQLVNDSKLHRIFPRS